MSKYMQIDIRLIPFYENRFEKSFPHIAKLLTQRSYRELVEKGISLYEIADTLETIAESPNTPSDLRNAISPFVEKLMSLKEVARDYLLARRLNELDQALYRMEDVFEDLEGAL